MASWEYFIYSKSGRYTPEDIAKVLITKGCDDGINCKATVKQEINRDHFTVLGERFEENINISQGQEGVVFSSSDGNEKNIKNIFNVFQRRDIEVKLNFKFGDIDYKSYFEDAPIEINGKTYFAKLKSEKEMMSQLHTPGMHFSNQEEFEHFTQFNDTRYHFYDCTFDDILFSENVVIGQLERCRFNRCTFENFDAENISFKDSVLTTCQIINSNFKECSFDNTGLYQSQISKSNFTNANFAASDIKRTRFDENNLSAVKFHGALLDGVHITKSTINNPVEGLYTENITWNGATYQEIEVNRNRIASELKLFPFSINQVIEQSRKSLEPLSVKEQNSSEINGKQIRFKILPANSVAEYPYNVQVHFKYDFTDKFVYSGMGRFCENLDEVNKYINKIKREYSEYEYQFSYEGINENEILKLKSELENTADSLEPLPEATLKNDNSLSNEHTQLQFEIINKYNPAPNEYQTWIRSADDIKSFEETLKDSDYIGWEQDGFDESYSASDAENALKSGEIRVYSSHPIKQGVFVTPSYMEAQSYSGDGRIYSKEVALDEIAWIDPTQGQYANVDEYKLLSPSENMIENKVESKKLTLEEYLAQRGLASPVDDYMIDKLRLPHGQSKYDERKMHENARKSSQEYHEKRNAAIQEYNDKVASGEIIKPTNLERYIKKANGNPDKQSVQAARRVLEKRGYVQNENGEWINKNEIKVSSNENTFERANKKLSDEIKANLQMFIDSDKKVYGEVQQSTLKAVEMQGYQYVNGTLEKLDAIQDNQKAEKAANHTNKIIKEEAQSKPLTKEEFDNLTSEIKDIAKTYQSDPELLTDYLAFKAQFYNYSPTNTMLIHLQNPYATFVASFTKWKQLGYSIRKGQHHIKISRPIETTRFPKTVNGKTTWTDIKYASPEEKAQIANGELEVKKVTKFIPHQVFDISQTDCPIEDYPKFYNMGHPDMEQQQLYECVKEYAKQCGFTVLEEDLSSISLHGYYDKSDNSIHINSLMEDTERLRTMCHELAHGVLHKTSTQPVEIMEFEAECFSAMLKRKMGFPVSEESKRYIKQYYNKSNYLNNGKFDMNKTLNRLSKAFNHTSSGIDKTISDMGFSQDRELSHTLTQANSKAVDVSKISENFMQALS